ncbi:MAG: ABC transporter ATP-binding protein [Chrysiogenetes bacterium]|nr:ABC transporter ATP-binding protein [Chrysiogenetes bacterium]
MAVQALKIAELKKSYVDPAGDSQCVLDVRKFELAAGEQVALRGTSGCGKTTFLHLISGIVQADEGEILVAGTDIAALGESARDRYRAEHIGYVFQSFNLLQGLTAVENVMLGMAFGAGSDEARARELLDRVGLAGRTGYFPNQLSIGQQQRVALARALCGAPQLVLADEPTGNLDPHHAGESLALIRELCREQGAALLLVTHDERISAQFERSEDLMRLNRAVSDLEGVA